MKKAIIAILTISIFCVAFSVKTRAYVGAPQNDWLNLYQNYLEGFLTDNSESYDKENIGIRLIYLDDDNIPELCCIYQNNNDELVLFTIKDGEVSYNNLNMEFPYGIWFSSYDFFNDLYEEYHN